jgi:hypothetical protein
VDDNQALESLVELERFLQRLKVKERQLKNSKFNGKMLDFKKNENVRVSLGALIYKNMNFNIDSVVKLNFNISPVYEK